MLWGIRFGLNLGIFLRCLAGLEQVSVLGLDLAGITAIGIMTHGIGVTPITIITIVTTPGTITPTGGDGTMGTGQEITQIIYQTTPTMVEE